MAIEGIGKLLGRHPFFAGLDEEALAFIAGCCTNVRLAEGEYIFREGGPADAFYVVRAGRVAIEISSPERGVLVIDSVGAGETAGMSWLSPPYRCQFDARAVEPTRAIRINATCLRDKCEEDARLGYLLMQGIAGVMRQRLQSARIRLLDLYRHAPAG